ncbi:MAG: phytoene/squalene synthase family protein [Xanthobacteraceae bacterium]
MQDAFAYCMELVRNADRDRYLATLFAPAEHRNALYALYAFNVEIVRVREAAREPMPGEIRLQWWREVVSGERDGEAGANPVAAALLDAIARYRLPASTLTGVIEAHRFDLYDEPMATTAELENYARRTSSAVIDLAAQILGARAPAVAEPAGIALAIVDLLRALPLHVARHQLYVPVELLQRHGVTPEAVFARQSSDGLNAALAELQDLAWQYLAAVRQALPSLPPQALSAVLPVALVRPSLNRLQRSDAFAPREVPSWWRQWLIWRAARNPARIAAQG